MKGLHYIADDLGVSRDWRGVEAPLVVTERTWIDKANAWVRMQLGYRLAAEARMDEWLT